MRVFFLFLLGVLLFALISQSLISIPLQLVYLNESVYLQAIESRRGDPALREMVIDWLAGSDSGPGLVGDPVLQYLDAQDREEMAGRILPAGWPEAQLARLATGALAYLNLEANAPVTSLDLEPLKNNITAHSRDMAEVVVSSWPPCTAEQLLGLAGEALNGSITEMPNCQPGQALQPVVVGLAQARIEQNAAQMPLFAELTAEEWQNPTWWPWYRIARSALPWVPFITLGLIALVFLFSVRSLRQAAQVTGWAALAAGIASIILVGVIVLLARWVTSGALALVPAFPAEGAEYVKSLFQMVERRFMLSGAIWSGLGTAAGAVLLLASRMGSRSAR